MAGRSGENILWREEYLAMKCGEYWREGISRHRHRHNIMAILILDLDLDFDLDSAAATNF